MKNKVSIIIVLALLIIPLQSFIFNETNNLVLYREEAISSQNPDVCLNISGFFSSKQIECIDDVHEHIAKYLMNSKLCDKLSTEKKVNDCVNDINNTISKINKQLVLCDKLNNEQKKSCYINTFSILKGRNEDVCSYFDYDLCIKYLS